MAGLVAHEMAWALRVSGVGVEAKPRVPQGGHFHPPAWLGLELDPIETAKDAYVRGVIEIDEFERRVEAILL